MDVAGAGGRTVRAGMVLLTTLGLSVAAMAGLPASAGTMLDVAIVSPKYDQLLRGDIVVSARVQVPDGEGATVNVSVTGGTTAQNSSSAPVVLPVGSCPAGCDVALPVSTSPTMASYSSGSRTVTATVVTTGGASDRASVQVQLQPPGRMPSTALSWQGSAPVDTYSVAAIDHDMDLVVTVTSTPAPDAIRVRVPLADGSYEEKDLPTKAVAGGVEARLPVGPGSPSGTGWRSFVAAGRYGGSFSAAAYTGFSVRTTTPVSWTGQVDPVAEGYAQPTATWTVAGASESHAYGLGARSTLDGSSPGATLRSSFEYVDRTAGIVSAQSTSATAMTAGPHRWTWQLFDSNGLPWGTPFELAADVTAFQLEESPPPLVVGRTDAIPVSARSATADPLVRCHVGLVQRGSATVEEYCQQQRPATSLAGVVRVTPQVAGRTTWVHHAGTTRHQSNQQHAVVVHPARGLTVVAPKVTSATRARVTVTAHDTLDTSRPAVAARGAVVVLQLQRPGSTTWVSSGRSRVGTTGVAGFPVTVTAGTRWRAVTSTPYGQVASAVAQS